jgi:hypothetical protein
MKTLRREHLELFNAMTKKQICELFRKYILVIENEEGGNYFSCNEFTDTGSSILGILKEGELFNV